MVDEIRQTNLDLSKIDNELEVLTAKNRASYVILCATYKVDALSIKVVLVKASDESFIPNHLKNTEFYEKYSKVGWDYYDCLDVNIVSLPCDHFTMLRNATNRSLCLRSFCEKTFTNKF